MPDGARVRGSLMFFSGIRDKRAAAVDAIEAWTLWLADNGMEMLDQASFRCRILREEDPVPADAWCRVFPILGQSVVELGPFMLDACGNKHGPFMLDLWGDENEIFRKLRLRAAVAWYLTASEAEQPVAEAMVEALYSSLVERPRIAKTAIEEARPRIATEALAQVKTAASERGKKAAAASKAETNEMRKEVVDWLKKNAQQGEKQTSLCTRLGEAKLVAVKPSTLKFWVSQWHKAGRPK